MPVPTYDKFIEPLLRFLATQPDGALARVAHEQAAAMLGLTEEEKQELLPSGTQGRRGGVAGEVVAIQRSHAGGGRSGAS